MAVSGSEWSAKSRGIPRQLFTKCGIVFGKLRHDDLLSVTLYTLARHDIELHQIDRPEGTVG